MNFRTTLTVLAAVAAAGILTDAHATGGNPWQPTPAPQAQQPAAANATASAISAAQAGAASVAGSKASTGPVSAAGGSASGGTSSATSAAGDSAATTGASSSGSNLTSVGGETSLRSLSLFVPPPVFTPPMPRPEVPVSCPAPTETQSALSIGSGLVMSKAESMRDNDPCTAIKYSQLLWDRCQYQKADRALALGLKLFAKKAGEPWDAAPDANLTNYAPKECAILTAPPPAKPQALNFIYLPPPVARTQDKPAEPIAPPATAKPYSPAKPKVVKRKEAREFDACALVEQCTRKPTQGARS